MSVLFAPQDWLTRNVRFFIVRLMLARRALGFLALALTCGSIALVGGVGAVSADAAAGPPTTQATTVTTAASPVGAPTTTTSPLSDPALKGRLKVMQDSIDASRENASFLLIPISILIGILSLGGVLGIVFSIRDQQRVSQLHELSVGAETASQRRGEQTYTYFLEESQKTLTLVNDTLALGKEATDRAAHTMELKAETNLAGIEERAQALLLPLLTRGVFEGIFDKPEDRGKLERIAAELEAIEGYRVLQDIALPPYSRFVKGMAEYLDDDLAGALKTLRIASQDASIRELQLFAVYWVAYLYDAQGKFDEAASVCRSGMERLSRGRAERVEFERMIDSSAFYAAAKAHSTAHPRDRFDAVSTFLADLEAVAEEASEADTDHSKATTHEVAEARADMFMWVAFAADRLFDPIPAAAFAPARKVHAQLDGANVSSVKSAQMNADWRELGNGDELRAWAWLQAAAAYGAEHLYLPEGEDDLDAPGLLTAESDFKLLFGKAETNFGMARAVEFDEKATADLVKRYRAVELAVNKHLGSHREQRRSVELAHMWLVAAGRMVWLQAAQGNAGAADTAEGDLRNAQRLINDKLGDVGQVPDLTLFSQLQRRAVTVPEFRDEMEAFVRQAHEWEPLLSRKGEKKSGRR
jgi:hypothetical protein